MKSGTLPLRLGALFLVFVLFVLSIDAAFANPPIPNEDELPPPRPAPQPMTLTDLATYPASRWIVQINDAPIAQYRGNLGGLPATGIEATGQNRLNPNSTESVNYRAYLVAKQRAFVEQLTRIAPNARVEHRYQTVLNGMAVKMSSSQAAAVRKLPNVRAVTPDMPFQMEMYSTTQQIGAPALWAQLGGQANAGAGVKVAVIDSGIFVTYTASLYSGNPCFDDSGYPPAPAGFPKGDPLFTNKKVIVAKTYFRPYDPPDPSDATAIQGPGSSPHGNHVAGTVACNAGTIANTGGATVTLSGVAPRAWLMNYRVFYSSTSTIDFQNGNAYVAELVAAIDDAVADGADIISNSWGASYQNTLAWPDPMVQASEAAVDAGVVMVYANGNAGPDTATVNAPANSPKVIGVGAVTKNATIASGDITITAGITVPGNLQNIPVVAASFGPVITTTLGPSTIISAEAAATNGSALACWLGGDASPFPTNSLSGTIALIARGTCNFSEKVYNAQRGGAIGAKVYNSATGGDNLQAMGPGAHAGDVTIPSWFMKRSTGLNIKSFITTNPGAQGQFVYAPRPAPNVGDVMAGFSSRGPTQDKVLKPDLVAPGVDVVSAGYNGTAYPSEFTGFGSASGTSMATPHVAGSAALLKQLHQDWKPWQIKSALMNTANENVFLNTTLTARATLLDRGAGRIDLTKAGAPGLTFDLPSLSGGELAPGQGVTFTVHAQDVSGISGTWNIAVTGTANLNITVMSPSVSIAPSGTQTLTVRVQAPLSATGSNNDGVIALTNGIAHLHIPVWARVIAAAPVADVLLIDDDASSVDPSFADYSSVYKNMLDALGISYQYLDIGTGSLPSLNALFGYKAMIIFTGDNDDFALSGFSLSNHNRISEWLDSGGRLWTTGQNFAEVSDDNTNFNSPALGRARLYHGYLGLMYAAGNVYSGTLVPRPTAQGFGPMAGMTLDLGPGGDGANNPHSIEGSFAIGDTDTYAASDTMTTLFAPQGSTAPPGAYISFGRSSEPSLEESRLQFRYRSLSMGFGMEGINNNTGFTTRGQVARRALDWLLDAITVDVVSVSAGVNRPALLTANASSSSGAVFTAYRWDFGDGSPIAVTTTPQATHTYSTAGIYTVRVEATDGLGHRSVSSGRATISWMSYLPIIER